MQFRSSHVATIFDITIETVHAWSKEFAEYLSPTANPGKRKTRLFTEDDMRVFVLVAELRSQRITFAEIHASLKSGSRGEPPAINPDEVQSIVSSNTETRLSLELERARQAQIVLQGEITRAREQLAKMREIEDENIRLKTRLEDAQKRESRLDEIIAELTHRVEAVSKEAGREYAKGFVEGLKNREKD